MADSVPQMRTTRFVCVSDTHNAMPGGAFKLPRGDVLIHAGDMTNQGSYSELRKSVKWLEEADFEAKIIVAGNHDITLDSEFYRQYGLYFHNQDPQDTVKCQALLENSTSLLWLNHESKSIKLRSPAGPRTKFKIFGSPYSPARGMWAFGYNVDEAQSLWNRIPLDSDIVVTHTPPKYHCDESKERRAAGCEALRQMLWRVRPRLAICGHVHEGRGVERVKWDLSVSNAKYKELGVDHWKDPGKQSKSISFVDLTSSSNKPLENDGSLGDLVAESVSSAARFSASDIAGQDILGSPGMQPHFDKPRAQLGLARMTVGLLADLPVPVDTTFASIGQGGIPSSQRSDVPALSGRLGRKETCIINAAIMASSWPHQGRGKTFNKPVVIDIDLPICEE